MAITVKRPERTVEIITDLSMLDEIDRLTKEVSAPSTTLADTRKVKAARRLEALADEVKGVTLSVRFQAVSARENAEAMAAAAVPKDDQHPDGTDWFKVVQKLAPAATVSVEWADGSACNDFNPDTDWPALLDSMSDYQVAEILGAIIALGRETGAGPKAIFEKASSILRASGQNSSSPERSASRTNGYRGGNRNRR